MRNKLDIDLSKIGKIGIDRVVISNFKILNFNKLERKEILNKLEYSEKIEIKSKNYNLIFSENLTLSGKEYNCSSLEFNPNKIRDGHNIYNSTPQELKETLINLVKELNEKGIEIDITNAKIKEIELNITLGKGFEELSEVMLLIGRANYKKAIGIYSFLSESIPAKIKKDRCLYINNKLNFKNENNGKVIKIYDKTFEMRTTRSLELKEKLTRVEVLLGRDYFRYAMKREGLTNDLKDFIEFANIKNIFLNSIINELVDKPLKQLEIIKKKLNSKFLKFRRNETLKRIERNKIKKLGGIVPEYLREERGVFEYLKRVSWIFDYSFLYKLVIDNISSNHHKDFERQIVKRYLKIKNREIYEELINKIFGDNFF